MDDNSITEKPIDIFGNTFEDNAVIKGLVYIDLPSRSSAAVQIYGNQIDKTFTYMHTSVFHIRTQVATVLAEADMTEEADLNCGGFLVAGNNIADVWSCPSYGGSVIMFECISSDDTIGNNDEPDYAKTGEGNLVSTSDGYPTAGSGD